MIFLPIAIIGIGCRFPGGAHGPDAFWKILRDGVDAITDVPADRWNTEAHYDSTPGRKGKTIARWGGFLDAIDQFDTGFFGVSPREAAYMDPQQRLLLHAAWEALDDGGEPFDAGRGAPVGVFVGFVPMTIRCCSPCPMISARSVLTPRPGAPSASRPIAFPIA
jgi:acyl transferase domain-containing protein